MPETTSVTPDPAPSVNDALGFDETKMKEVTGKLADVQRQKSAADEKTFGQLESATDRLLPRAEHLSNAARVEAQQLKPWNEQQESAARRTDPIEAFGSIGSVFGILASAFTHAPMESALNASASAMNAIREGDEKAYNRAYKASQDNAKMAMERHKIQHEAYQDAMSLLATNMAVGQSKLQINAARFGDKQVQVLLDAGMSKEVQELLKSREDLATKFVENELKRAEAHAELGRLWAPKTLPDGRTVKFDPKNPTSPDSQEAYKLFREESARLKAAEHNYLTHPTDAQEVARRANEYKAQGMPDSQAFDKARSEVAQAAKNAKTGGQIAKEQEKADKVESVRNQIKEAIRLIDEGDKSGNSVVGAKGAYGTAKEFFWGDKSEHARFVALVSTLQQEVKPLLTGSTRAMLTKADRDTVDRIVPGIGFLRNSKQAKDTLLQLDAILSRTDLTPGGKDAVPLPERFKNEPDGTEIPQKSTGRIFIKRGDKLVPKE